LARFPRVYVKISHTWSISKTGFPWADTYEQVKKVYHAFGGSRIMWGTDWPVCLKQASYAETLAVVRDEMDFFTPEDREWVLGKTALRLWQFPT
jgi:predicted TIM-barrel fold metal-dependent hydrolase